MNKRTSFEAEIIKNIKRINAECIAAYKKLFEENDVMVVDNLYDWKENAYNPTDADFREYKGDAAKYIKSFGKIDGKNLDRQDYSALLYCPQNFCFIPKKELDEFKSEIYPKLYAEWAKANKHGNDKEILRQRLYAKISELRHELDALN
ncbi:MAG: hypothetical protein MJ193_02165 [Clostridia bacterium]|nr:hypothetical protein [Clostridia bacterium]